MTNTKVATFSLLILFSSYSWGGNMVYQFINPNFGGNPLNGPNLLNSAQAQNSYKASSSGYDGYQQPSALDTFTQAIQSQLLGSLMGNVSQGKPGRLVTPDFVINVTNTDGQLMMNILDRKTNQTSQVEISGLTGSQ